MSRRRTYFWPPTTSCRQVRAYSGAPPWYALSSAATFLEKNNNYHFIIKVYLCWVEIAMRSSRVKNFSKKTSHREFKRRSGTVAQLHSCRQRGGNHPPPARRDQYFNPPAMLQYLAGWTRVIENKEIISVIRSLLMWIEATMSSSRISRVAGVVRMKCDFYLLTDRD